MANINTNREFTTENLLDAICDYLGVNIVDSETYDSCWNQSNPIRLAPNCRIQNIGENNEQ
ncbi:MAG: hypothetical protein GY861_13845 [bacterium]|nr:hypothetical protein [bacterium]